MKLEVQQRDEKHNNGARKHTGEPVINEEYRKSSEEHIAENQH